MAALKAEIQSLDEASEGRQQQAAALAEAYSRDISRFAELEEIVALRRQMSVTPLSPLRGSDGTHGRPATMGFIKPPVSCVH